MAGLRVTILVNDGASEPLRQFAIKVSDLRPLMANIGEIALSSVQENFESGGRPKWKPLAPSTIKRKGHTKPLLQTGTLRSVVRRVTENSVVIGVQPAARAYAAIHHFGGQAGRNRKVTIPARPYMLLQPEDLAEVDALVQRWPQDAAT